jgi:hypothetical protein
MFKFEILINKKKGPLQNFAWLACILRGGDKRKEGKRKKVSLTKNHLTNDYGHCSNRKRKLRGF